MRWRHRQQAGETLVHKPDRQGRALDLEALNARSVSSPRAERTRGTGALYATTARHLAAGPTGAGGAVRRELQREAQALEHRIEWQAPGLVWSMDDAEVNPIATGPRASACGARPGQPLYAAVLAPRRWPMGHDRGNLVELFEQYAPPLFSSGQRRNLNHQAVLGALSEYGVIR